MLPNMANFNESDKLKLKYNIMRKIVGFIPFSTTLGRKPQFVKLRQKLLIVMIKGISVAIWPVLPGFISSRCFPI